MSDLVERMVRQLLRREPTAEDYQRVNEMLANLPSEMRSSPGQIAEVILRNEFLAKLEASVRQASFETQQKIHADLPHRIDEAALKALCKIRNMIPSNAESATRQLLATALFVFVCVAFAFSCFGWVIGQDMLQRSIAAAAPAIEDERARCVDVTIGRIAIGGQSSSSKNSALLQTTRDSLLNCVSASRSSAAGGY